MTSREYRNLQSEDPTTDVESFQGCVKSGKLSGCVSYPKVEIQLIDTSWYVVDLTAAAYRRSRIRPRIRCLGSRSLCTGWCLQCCSCKVRSQLVRVCAAVFSACTCFDMSNSLSPCSLENGDSDDHSILTKTITQAVTDSQTVL